MSLAYASKDQMKVWKSASKPDKDYPDDKRSSVMFQIKKDESGCTVTLSASSGVQLVRRNIQAETDAYAEAPLKVAIPRDAVEQAEKAMKQGDRAYFDESKITVHEVIEDPDIDLEHTRVKAIIPYVEQLDMFIDMDSPIETIAAQKHDKVVTIDASVLKRVVDQMKNGDALCYVTIRMGSEDDGVFLTAFEGIEDEELTAVVMPLKV